MNDFIKTKSFVWLLLKIVAIISTIFLIITIVYLYKQSYSQSFQDVQKNTQTMLKMAVQETDDQLNVYETKLEFLSKMYADPSKDSTFLSAMLFEILQQNSNITSSFVYFQDTSQNLYAYISDSGLITANLSEKIGDKFINMMMKKSDNKVNWKTPECNEVSKQIETTIWKSIIRNNNSGIVGFNLLIDNVFDRINAVSLSESSFFVLSEEGVLLTDLSDIYPKGTLLFEEAQEQQHLSLANLSKLMMNGETGVMQPMQFSRKQSYFVNFQPVPDARFSLGMILNEKMLFHQIYSTNRNVLLLLLFEIILLLFVVYRLIIKRMRFLKELSNTIDYMGKGVFGTMLPEITTQDEFLQLSDDFHQMQERISNHFSNSLSTTRTEEQEACKKEQKRCFQNLFLPPDYRKFAFSPLGSCTLKINYFPAKTFGGDFYDYFFFNEHQFCLLMGNVGGTSASKSLQIAFIMSLIREQLHEKISLARFSEQLNNRIQSINQDQCHIKLLLTVIDSKTQTMNFVNIGYDLLYLIREQVIINIESIHGKALGMVADAKFSSSTLGLHKGDMLFFFDSAAANFLNKSGVNYSKERVEQLLTTNRKESPVNLLNHISEDIDLYLKGVERLNDYTMMALKFFEDDHHDEK